MNCKDFLGALAVFAGMIPATLAAQGRLGVLPQGEYVCALPGDAAGAAYIEQPAMHFAITGASSYRAGASSGAYLLEDKRVTFTRGPLRGKRFLRIGSGMLQELDREGHLGRVRCHRAGPVSG